MLANITFQAMSPTKTDRPNVRFSGVLENAGLVLFFAWMLLVCNSGRLNGQDMQMTLNSTETQVEVQVNDLPFTVYRFKGYPRPILYPVFGPGQDPMTRSFPIEDALGEARDHPHHKSIWFAHGNVNGVDFWGEKGTIESVSVATDELNSQVISTNRWRSKDQTVCTDRTRVRFGASELKRWIDYDVTIFASEGDVLLGDTKEGTFAIRTHPDLQLSANPEAGVPEVFGHALNSEGERDQAIWGKRAKWVYYYGPVDGMDVGIVFMDHPQNLRHPTTWHARDYGLVAANPFGLHDFLGEPAKSGDVILKKGESLRLVYRLLFLARTSESKECDDLFQSFANDPQVESVRQ
jgi:hypothetical protein